MDYNVNYSDEGQGGWVNTAEVDFSTDFWEEAPKPAYWRVLIMPVRPKETSKGGIVLARAHQDAQEVLNFMGRVVSLGPQAGTHERLGGDGKTPAAAFPKVGDYIIYGRYAGQRLLYKGAKLLILNDDELLACAPNPDALSANI